MYNHQAKKRIQLSTALSILVHALLLSIGITGASIIKQRFKSMEAIVVNTSRDQNPPLTAKFQSQRNTIGGGTTDRDKTIRSFTHDARKNHRGNQKKEEKSASTPENEKNWVTSIKSIDVLSIVLPKHPTKKYQGAGKQQVNKEIQLLQLKAQLHHLLQRDNQDHKRLFIGITARKTAHAQYTNAIAEKIEKIGTRYFPEEAKNHPFKLIVTISVQQDGRLEKVQVERSSGSAGLDRAALTLIQKAFPAQAFPASISKDYFAIDMTRTIYFDPQGDTRKEKEKNTKNS